VTRQELARIYGAFRVCYLTDEGLKVALGENDGLDELAATQYAAAAADERGVEPWVEHQNPETGEWKKW
jgi:hypothetical protein